MQRCSDAAHAMLTWHMTSQPVGDQQLILRAAPHNTSARLCVYDIYDVDRTTVPCATGATAQYSRSLILQRVETVAVQE
eukprot:19570-Heterococcus_DN1.PRE.2